MSQIFPFDAQVLDTTSGNLFTGQLNQSNPEDSYIFTIDSPSNFIADIFYNFNDGNAGSGAFNLYSPNGDIFNGREFVDPGTVTTGFFLSGQFATSLSEPGTYRTHLTS